MSTGCSANPFPHACCVCPSCLLQAQDPDSIQFDPRLLAVSARCLGHAVLVCISLTLLLCACAQEGPRVEATYVGASGWTAQHQQAVGMVMMASLAVIIGVIACAYPSQRRRSSEKISMYASFWSTGCYTRVAARCVYAWTRGYAMCFKG